MLVVVPEFAVAKFTTAERYRLQQISIFNRSIVKKKKHELCLHCVDFAQRRLLVHYRVQYSSKE